MKPRFEDYEGREPLDFVVSLNLRRRHLSESQRAMVAAKIATLVNGGDRTEKQSANWRTAPSAEQAAQMLNVGTRSIERARTVHSHGTPGLIAAVERGEVSVSQAYCDSAKAAEPSAPSSRSALSIIGRATSRHRLSAFWRH